MQKINFKEYKKSYNNFWELKGISISDIEVMLDLIKERSIDVITQYKKHLVEINNLRIVLEDGLKRLRKEYKSSTSKYDLVRLGNTGKKKKERLERITEHLKECNDLLATWDTVTNDQLRGLIHNGKSI